MYKTTTAVFIFILVGIIIYLTQCKKYQPTTATKTVVKVVKDSSGWTKPKPEIVYKPQFIPVKVPGKAPDPIFVDTGSIVYITLPVDTQAILNHYFSVYKYTDSFETKKNGATVKVRVTDTVTKNQIIARKWYTEFTPAPSILYREIYIEGGGYTSRIDLISGAKVGMGYINRKRQHLKVEVLYTNGRLQYGGTFGQTLGKW